MASTKKFMPAAKPFDQTWQSEPDGGRFGAPPMTMGTKKSLRKKKLEVSDYSVRAVPPSLVFNNLSEVRVAMLTPSHLPYPNHARASQV